MSIKSILVHLANDADHMARLRVAYALAKKHNAHVTALYISTPINMPAGSEGRAASRAYLEEAAEIAEEKAKLIEAEFRAWCATHPKACDFVHSRGNHLEELARHSYSADLTVVSQTEGYSLEDALADEQPDHVAMVGASPALILPTGWGIEDVGRRVVVAWKPTRPCSRAVRDSLPILHKADSVTVVQVLPDAKARETGTMLMHWLERHGIKATREELPKTGNTAETLEDFTATAGDLLVMGGYSHSRLRELLLGGVTRRLLEGCRVPILMGY